MSATTATTATTAAFTLASFDTALDAVTAIQLDSAKKALGTVDLKAALAAYLKTGAKKYASAGAYASVFKGILNTVAYGNRTALQGFCVASKKAPNGAFSMLQGLGILTETGAVAIGVMDGGKVWADRAEPRIMYFVALCHTAELLRMDAAKTARELAAALVAEPVAAPVAELVAEPVAAPVAELTDGQRDDADISRLIKRAALISRENVEFLMAALAVLAAPVAAPVDAPVDAPVAAKPKRSKNPVTA